jgi:hypothetical protein
MLVVSADVENSSLSSFFFCVGGNAYKKVYRSTNVLIGPNLVLRSLYMDGPSDLSSAGCAVRPDGTLKDASEIVFYRDKDDDSPIAPTKVHPFFTNQPPPGLMVAGSRRSARTTRPSARIIDPDNAMNSGSRLSMTTIKRKAPDSIPLRRVSQKLLVDSNDGLASQIAANESSANESSICLLHDDSDVETDHATDEFEALEAMAAADLKVCLVSRAMCYLPYSPH